MACRLVATTVARRALPAGFIAPCLPTKTDKLLSGGQWLHKIKHDGFRIIARKNGPRVRLYSRPGKDLTRRFPLDDCQACRFGQAGKERHDVAR